MLLVFGDHHLGNMVIEDYDDDQDENDENDDDDVVVNVVFRGPRFLSHIPQSKSNLAFKGGRFTIV